MTAESAQPTARQPTAANRFGVDYRLEAARLPAPPAPIIDIHTHVMGKAAAIYDQARRIFGVSRTYSMTQIHLADATRELLGDSVRFIAFPSFSDADRGRAFRDGYLDVIKQFHARFNARMLKLWCSPRLREILPDIAATPYGATDVAEVDAPWRVRACELGASLGMMYMIHICDPDTWFNTRYKDPARFGDKPLEYARFERMLDRFPNPWIAAHMGGWPENLPFLDRLLSNHPNLYLDTSATKWVVRALGQQPAETTRAFFIKWRTRILFGSDIVASDDHLSPQKKMNTPMSDLADSPESAFDLYASRYWALRTMFESTYDAESNIADPDLMMLDPKAHTAMSAPTLRGMSLPPDVLADIYHNNAVTLVERWHADHA